MSSIGPTLPPHLQPKRKRNGAEESESNETAQSSKDLDTSGSKKLRTIGPSMPPNVDLHGQTSNEENMNAHSSALPGSEEKADQSRSQRVRINSPSLPSSSEALKHELARPMGPTLPPADIATRPNLDLDQDGADDGSDSDEDFGPALPGSDAGKLALQTDSSVADVQISKSVQSNSGRDDWMLAPPTSGDWTSRIDPSKMKNRGFSSGPRAAPKTGGDMSLWTETPEEKRKRLEEELLGVRKADPTTQTNTESARRDLEASKVASKVQAYNDKNRAAPLYSIEKADADEDDPSNRAFDRERDIGGGKLSHAEQKKMMSKAADFGSRFSKGTYL